VTAGRGVWLGVVSSVTIAAGALAGLDSSSASSVGSFDFRGGKAAPIQSKLSTFRQDEHVLHRLPAPTPASWSSAVG
jgi:hypothetical protein